MSTIKILQDTREQKPLEFELDEIVTEVETVTLPVGDYHCEFTDGSRPPLVFERKSLQDLYGTMTRGYPRFKRLLAKASKLEISMILIIEASQSQVLAGYDRSEFPGPSCLQKLFTLWIKYDLFPVFCRSRPEAARFIVETYKAIGRLTKTEKREKARKLSFNPEMPDNRLSIKNNVC